MNNSFTAGLFVGMLACVASLPLPAIAQSSALVDAYMQKSGLDHVIGQIEGEMLRGIDHAQAQPRPETPKLSPEQLERLRSAVKVAYGADRLMVSVRSQLVALLPSGDTELMLKWLDTPLAKRATALEVAGSTPEAAQRAIEIAPKILAEMAPSRKDDLERLLNSSGAADVSTAIVLAQQIGIARGMAQAAGTHGSNASLRVDDIERYRRHWPRPWRRHCLPTPPWSTRHCRTTNCANMRMRSSELRHAVCWMRPAWRSKRLFWRLRSNSGEGSWNRQLRRRRPLEALGLPDRIVEK